jgi:four helix bundle protein
VKYERFEELPVWNAAIELAIGTYKLSADQAFLRQGSLRDQIERAAVSVSNNIAEGFERGSTSDLLKFIYIARGSSGEVRSMLFLMERLAAFSHLKFEISNLKSNAEEIARQLRAWAKALQESPIKGQRFLTQKSQRFDKARHDRDQMLKELQEIQRAAQR